MNRSPMQRNLIVVFEKPNGLSLIIPIRTEVIADGPGMAFAKAIVEALVVGVIETLLLQLPFEIPVGLGHKNEAR